MEDEKLPICSPSEWPCISFSNLKTCQKPGEQIVLQCLRGLLLQSLISCYLSLLTYSLAFYDPVRLSRLISKRWDSKLWCQVFGCGVDKQNECMTDAECGKFRTPSHKICTYFLLPKVRNNKNDENGYVCSNPSNISKNRSAIHTSEQLYVEPLSSLSSDDSGDSNRSSISSSSSSCSGDSEYSFMFNQNNETLDPVLSVACQQHRDTESFSWILMRYLILMLAKINIIKMATMCEFGRFEMASCLSSSVMDVMNTVNIWIKQSHSLLKQTAAIERRKQSSINDFSISPFCEHPHSNEARTLWNLLSVDSSVSNILHQWANNHNHNHNRTIMRKHQEMPEKKKRSDNGFHEHETFKFFTNAITAFSINMLDCSLLVLASPVSVVEVEIKPKLNSIDRLFNCDNQDEDDEDNDDYDELLNSCAADFDGIYMDDRKGSIHLSDFLSIKSTEKLSNDFTRRTISSEIHKAADDKILHERPDCSNVCVLQSHPQLPHYALGRTDGSCSIAFWGMDGFVCEVRPKMSESNISYSSKAVSQLKYSCEGYRLALSDLSGQLELYQIHNAQATMSAQLRSHTKHCFDMINLNASSLFATCGLNNDGKNVALWDTLLPNHKACVAAFNCHENGGALCLAFCQSHNMLVTAGKKGDIITFDIRKNRRISHIHHAHKSPITSIALEPQRSIFATGASDGCIKLWTFPESSELYSIAFTSAPSTHSNNLIDDCAAFNYINKTKGISLTTGISGLEFLDSQFLIASGYDGCLKYFYLPKDLSS